MESVLIVLTLVITLAFLFFVIKVLIGFRKNKTKMNKMSPEERESYVQQKNDEAKVANTAYHNKQAEKNTVRCPNCESVDVDFLGNDRKSFSVGKAAAGGALAGGVGMLAGFTGKKGKKNSWHCKKCGYTFKLKNNK